MRINRRLATTALGLALSAAAFASEHVVVQKEKNFSVSTMSVRTGDTILFKNDDPVVHNIFAKSDVKTFNVTQNPGEETPITADAAGTFVVRCAIHPKMKLTVKVE
ncbi:MAG TPA: plastocyanin/azurin family copper-binding protein [Vicinamibacteria bacterium]|nr:plastocyanin/azurin family copper-binding protein [Vicinamibacteria bacterium]